MKILLIAVLFLAGCGREYSIEEYASIEKQCKSVGMVPMHSFDGRLCCTHKTIYICTAWPKE